jgi:beta-lactam-binding protein with PASTA domain
MSNKPFTFFSFLKNVGIMAGIFTVLIVFFFYIYLPSTTNHGETITVPELVGMSYDDLEEYVVQRNLRFEIMEDSGYSEQYDPLAILTQNPKAGAKVKENRKIYLSLNAQVPPQVKMPNLINTDIQNARDILESHGLKMGEVEMVPDIATNAVLAQKFEGEDIEAGQTIPKGSFVDLVIADGEGKQRFATPDFIGKTVEEVKFQIQASRLRLDVINYIKVDSVRQNAVYKQLPPVGKMIQSGSLIEIWINGDKPEDPEEDNSEGR